MRRRIAIPLGIACALLLLIGSQNNRFGTWAIVCAACATLGYAAWIFERQFVSVLERLQTVLIQRMQGDQSARLGSLATGEIGPILNTLNELDYQQKMERQQVGLQLHRLNIVFRQMTDGVVIIGHDSLVELANQVALTLFDTAHADAVGNSFAQLVRHHEIIELHQRCVESQEPQTAVVDMRRDGLFLQIDVTPLVDDGVQGYVVLMHDLSSIRRMETVRRDFISNVSHELRTPLASIRAVIETLQDGALEEPELALRFLGRAANEVDSMTQMVAELLELSKIESGKVPLQLIACDLRDIIDSAVERLTSQVAHKSIRLDIQSLHELPPVLVDPQRIEQVLTNLLHNATKFTPAGGRIRIGASQNGSELMVSVRDNGIGIPEDDLSRVFERFYKTDRSRHSGGTGLGLAIAKHVVQAHRGDIWVTSKQNKGCVFYFTLPIA